MHIYSINIHTLEYAVGNLLNALGNGVLGIIAALACGEEEKLGHCLVINNSVLVRCEIGVSSVNVNRGKRGASCEDTGDCSCACGKSYGSKGCAAGEYALAEYESCLCCAGQEVNLGYRGASAEGFLLDFANATGNGNYGKLFAACKCSFTNGGESAACLKIKSCELRAS